jgi:hypothetical protein
VGYFYLFIVGALVGSGEGVVQQPSIVLMHFFFCIFNIYSLHLVKFRCYILLNVLGKKLHFNFRCGCAVQLILITPHVLSWFLFVLYHHGGMGIHVFLILNFSAFCLSTRRDLM